MSNTSRECTVLVIDNSDYSINGDWRPDRLRSQLDASRALATKRLNDNAESSVGLMVSANPKVIVTPTTEIGKISTALQTIKADGECEIIRSIKIAQLVLKNRPNRNARQRIIVFLGSPALIDEKEFIKTMKQLKKNNVYFNLVLLSDYDRHMDLLNSAFDVLGSPENNFFSDIYPGTPGTKFLDDALRRTPVWSGVKKIRTAEEEIRTGGDSGFQEDDDLLASINPDDDPELYMAIQLSIREEQERIRQAAEASRMTEEETVKEDVVEGELTEVATTTTNGQDITEKEDYTINAAEECEKPSCEGDSNAKSNAEEGTEPNSK